MLVGSLPLLLKPGSDGDKTELGVGGGPERGPRGMGKKTFPCLYVKEKEQADRLFQDGPWIPLGSHGDLPLGRDIGGVGTAREEEREFRRMREAQTGEMEDYAAETIHGRDGAWWGPSPWFMLSARPQLFLA